MMNIEKIGNCLVFNNKSFIPIGTFRTYKNKLLNSITLSFPDKDYIDLIIGEFTINGDIVTLDSAFNYFTTNSVPQTLNGGSGGTVDLRDYYTINQVDSKLNTYLKTTDFNTYKTSAPTKQFVSDEIITQLLPYATQQYVIDSITNIPIVDLTSYVKTTTLTPLLNLKADKSEMPSIIGLASEIFVTNAIQSAKPDLTPYALKTQVTNELNNKADKSQLNGLATQDYVDTAISGIVFPSLTGYVTTNILEVALSNTVKRNELGSYATEGFVRAEILAAQLNSDIDEPIDLSVFVNNDQMSSAMALKADVSSMIGLATEDYVDAKILENKPDLAPFVRTSTINPILDLKANKSEIPSIDGLATEDFVREVISNVDHSIYAQKEQVNLDLTYKADKTQLIGLATETYVVNAIDSIDLSPYATTVNVNSLLNNKLDKTEINKYALSTEIQLKIDGLESEIYNTLTQYVYTSDFNSALSLKADINEVTNSLNLKADKTTVASSLATKADKIFVDEQLNLKANISDMNALKDAERIISDNKYFHYTENPTAAVYNSDGLLSLQPKIWVGTVSTSTAGVWSADFSSAGFTEPPIVVVTGVCRNDGTAAGDASYASVLASATTTVGCRGRLSSASTAGLLAAMVSVAAEGNILLMAIGK